MKKQTSLSPILTEDQYIGFKQFAAENNIVNASQTYNELIPTGTKIIFDIARANTTDCSTFIVDANTQARPNRVITLPPNLNIIQPATYVKFPKTVCAQCCTGLSSDISTVKSNKKSTNTDFMLCRMNRLKYKLCQCTSLR